MYDFIASSPSVYAAIFGAYFAGYMFGYKLYAFRRIGEIVSSS